MSESDERRRYPRFASSARILWHPIDSDFLQLDRLRDVSQAGALVITESIAKLGTEVQFELLGEDQTKIASGLARVVWINPSMGMGIEFIEVVLGDEELDRLSDRPPPGAEVLPLPDLPIAEKLADDVRPLNDPTAAEPLTPREDLVAPVETSEEPELELDREEPAPASDDEARGPHPPARPAMPTPADPARRIQLKTTTRGAMTLGIDLGTTNVCTAYVAGGRTRIIPTRRGTNTTPSVVNLDEDGTLIVGHRAAGRQILNPLHTVYGSKRLLGRKYREDEVGEIQSHFAYPIVEAEEHRYGAQLGDRTFSMREIATRIIEDTRLIAEEHVGTRIDSAVITVPAYFTEVQRDAVRAAAKDARINVRRIVNEPTAAAVAWGYGRDLQTRLAVWDLGGGTFDVTIVDVRGLEFEVVGTGGDCFLGGVDFDDLIASHVFESFLAQEQVDFEPDPQQIARLREVAEQAKRALTVQDSYAVFLPEFAAAPANNLKTALTREKVEELTAPLVERCIAIATEVLESVGVSPTEVDEVLLVGGMTRVPAVQRAVEKLFGREPSRRVNPDEAVAIGAALLASRIDDPTFPSLLDVLPISLGFAEQGRKFLRVVGRHTRVPLERSLVVPVDPGATRVDLPLFQGEDKDATRNEYLCSIVVPELPSAGGAERSVEVALSLDEQCVLSARAVDPSSGAELPLTLDRSRSAAEVLARLGEYVGKSDARWRHPTSAVGRMFGRLRSLLGR